MCRKLALTGWVLLIPEDFEQARVISAILITVGAIAFVGCIFQLFYNVPPAPVLGVPLTAVIGTVSGPAFVLLFLVAIARGQREADEDDAKYM